MNNPIFVNAPKLITDTYIKSLYDSIFAGTQMFNTFFLTENANVREQSGLNYIEAIFSNPALNLSQEEVKTLLVNSFKSSFLSEEKKKDWISKI